MYHVGDHTLPNPTVLPYAFAYRCLTKDLKDSLVAFQELLFCTAVVLFACCLFFGILSHKFESTNFSSQFSATNIVCLSFLICQTMI